MEAVISAHERKHWAREDGERHEHLDGDSSTPGDGGKGGERGRVPGQRGAAAKLVGAAAAATCAARDGEEAILPRWKLCISSNCICFI